ncbi:hypothetical protein [Flavobacterium sp.]|uniref:DUF3108 domain-containing protein n=1 Tax=Flavobacterium sp. TaxID=239 RepID=UPI0039E5A2C2
MKTTILLLFATMSCTLYGQTLIPGKKAFESKWIKPEKQQMTWYAVKDTTLFEIGKVSTDLIVDKKQLTVVTQIDLKNAASPWIDSTAAEIETLKPIFHSSYNAQRDMRLQFGKQVTGFYNDKVKQVNTPISDVPQSAYFDSNLYPVLLRWLPLTEGYQQTIAIYDMNPTQTGVHKAFITEVKKGEYLSKKSGRHAVWIVSVYDEIGDGNTKSQYYIDQQTRQLWQQEITAGGRKMLMRSIE